MIDTLFAWVETAAALVGWASASAAVLILGAWLMRKALGGKLGPGWRSALGWLVVLRLLCLVAPESRWSWRNWVGHLSLVTGHSSLATQAPVLRTEGPMIRRELEQSASGRSQPVVSLPPSLGQTREESPSRLSSPHQPLTHEHDVAMHEPVAVRLEALTPLGGIVAPRLPARVIPWVGLLWGAGAVVMLGTAVARHCMFWRRVSRFSRPLPAGGETERWLEESRQLLRVPRQVRLRTLERLGSPVVFGFFRPFILLPPEVAGPLTAGEARHIFLHELAHIRCRDVLANWLLIAARALHWFNPFVWMALRQIVADRELLRDAMALRALPGGDSARREYGHTLLRLATTLSRPRLSPGLASLIHTEKEIQRRIAMIKTPLECNRGLWPHALAGSLALALAAVTFTAAARGQATAGAPADGRSPDSAHDVSASVTDPAASPSDATAPPSSDLLARGPTLDPPGNKEDTASLPLPEISAHMKRGLDSLELGRFDEAHNKFNKILALDPHNTAARRQLERLQRLIKSDLRTVAAPAPAADVVAVIEQTEQISPLQAAEERLAQLDGEIAKMTAEGKKQELEILTSLRGELLKEIYRAKYLPADTGAAAITQYKKAVSATRAAEKGKTARAPVEYSNFRPGKAEKDAEVRFPDAPSGEILSLRQQVEAMAQQVQALQQQLAQSNDSIQKAAKDLAVQRKQQSNDYKAQLGLLKKMSDLDMHMQDPKRALYNSYLADQTKQLKQMEQMGAGPAHPDVVALKAAMEAQKRQLNASAESLEESAKALRALQNKMKPAPKDSRPAEGTPKNKWPADPPSADLPAPKQSPKKPAPADPGASIDPPRHRFGALEPDPDSASTEAGLAQALASEAAATASALEELKKLEPELPLSVEATPEFKLEVTPEIKVELSEEPKPEIKLEPQSEPTPDVKLELPGLQSEVKLESKPKTEVKLKSKPEPLELKPEPTPDVRLELKPEPKPEELKPEAKEGANVSDASNPALPGEAPAPDPDLAKKRFTVMGAVAKPGAFRFEQGKSVTLLEAIGRAGGFTKRANPSKVSVQRMGGGAPIKLDAKKPLREKGIKPFLIEPGDVIHVSETVF
jgi:beta-lactamase regulating signal transducer with metallopeptidase domain